MFANEIPEKDLKQLIDSITKAITDSSEVKSILSELHKKKLINSSVLMFLSLNIQNIDSIGSEEKGECLPMPKGFLNDNPYYLDGETLTENEIKFQQFLMDRFDEDKWLKSLGIRY